MLKKIWIIIYLLNEAVIYNNQLQNEQSIYEEMSLEKEQEITYEFPEEQNTHKQLNECIWQTINQILEDCQVINILAKSHITLSQNITAIQDLVISGNFKIALNTQDMILQVQNLLITKSGSLTIQAQEQGQGILKLEVQNVNISGVLYIKGEQQQYKRIQILKLNQNQDNQTILISNGKCTLNNFYTEVSIHIQKGQISQLNNIQFSNCIECLKIEQIHNLQVSNLHFTNPEQVAFRINSTAQIHLDQLVFINCKGICILLESQYQNPGLDYQLKNINISNSYEDYAIYLQVSSGSINISNVNINNEFGGGISYSTNSTYISEQDIHISNVSIETCQYPIIFNINGTPPSSYNILHSFQPKFIICNSTLLSSHSSNGVLIYIFFINNPMGVGFIFENIQGLTEASKQKSIKYSILNHTNIDIAYYSILYKNKHQSYIDYIFVNNEQILNFNKNECNTIKSKYITRCQLQQNEKQNEYNILQISLVNQTNSEFIISYNNNNSYKTNNINNDNIVALVKGQFIYITINNISNYSFKLHLSSQSNNQVKSIIIISNWQDIGYPLVQLQSQYKAIREPAYTYQQNRYYLCGDSEFIQGTQYRIHLTSNLYCQPTVVICDAILFEVSTKDVADIWSILGFEDAYDFKKQLYTELLLDNIHIHWIGNNQTHQIAQFVVYYVNDTDLFQLQNVKNQLSNLQLQGVKLSNIHILQKPSNNQQIIEYSAQQQTISSGYSQTSQEETQKPKKPQQNDIKHDNNGTQNNIYYSSLYIWITFLIIASICCLGAYLWHRHKQRLKLKPKSKQDFDGEMVLVKRE